MTKSSACNKGKALHISQWIKGELGGGDGGRDDDPDDEEELELWSAERMDAKQTEVRRRLLTAARDARGDEVMVECAATDTVSVVSSPDNSQVGVHACS